MHFRYSYFPKVTLTTKDGEKITQVAGYEQSIEYNGERFNVMPVDDQDTNHWEQPGAYTATVYAGGLQTNVNITVVESPVQSITFEPIRVYEGVSQEFFNWVIPYTVAFKDGKTITGDHPTISYNDKFYSLTFNPRYSSEDWKAGESHSVNVSVMGYSQSVDVEVCGIESIQINENNGLTLIIHQTDGKTVEAKAKYLSVRSSNGGGYLETDKGTFNVLVNNFNTYQDVSITINNTTSNTLSTCKWLETNAHVATFDHFTHLGGYLFDRLSFNGNVNKENIDSIITSTFVYYLFNGQELDNDSLDIDADLMETKIKELFAVSGDIDMTLASTYDAATNTVDAPWGGVGGPHDVWVISNDNEQGFKYYSLVKKDYTTVLFDENYKIKCINTVDEIVKKLSNGWHQIYGSWYYVQNGNTVKGWKQDNGKWYYLDPSNNGAMITGLNKIGNNLYYMDSSGVMKTGWVQVGNEWYYATSSGAMASGWLKVGGSWYYLDSSTHIMYIGMKDIGNSKYFFNNSGVMQTGWIKADGLWYYANSSGAMSKGWLKLGTVWYYFDTSSCVMQTGMQKIGAAKYYFDSSGSMKTGWISYGGKWYYAVSSGALQQGWIQVGGTWYYMDPGTGIMCTGWVVLGNRVYYMSSSGAMKTGWVSDSGKWYYMNSSGEMKTGWLKVGSTWYYLDPSNGVMKTGLQPIGNATYFFDSSGAMQTGWIKNEGVWYYFASSGAAYKNGIYSIGGTKYAFDSEGIWCPYVLNTSTKAFHKPSCSYLPQKENTKYSNETRDNLIASGYEACGHCKP